MKRAFTLIELLVVIAIIAILAAILFPVFAQAKLAAKKTTSVSNIKQQSLSLLMYSSDNDDLYPRNDDCVTNSSLDPKYNDWTAAGSPTLAQQILRCNKSTNLGGFAWRVNHYAWQKWVFPYVKSVNMFYHPSFPLIKGTSSTSGVPTGFDQGEIANGYALNISITGGLNTWNQTSTAAPGQYRNSWLGGTQTAIPDVASTMMLTEQWFFPVTGAYNLTPDSTNPAVNTSYPPAFREHWKAMFYKSGGSGDCGVQEGVIDPTKVPFGVIPQGYADGHAKTIQVGQFLANTPTYAQYTGQPYSTGQCGNFASYFTSATTISPTAGSWPMWGLQ